MANTTIEMLCEPGATLAFVTVVDGSGTPDANGYSLTQIAGYLHSFTVPEAVTGRVYAIARPTVSGPSYGERYIDALTDTTDTFDLIEVTATATVDLDLLASKVAAELASIQLSVQQQQTLTGGVNLRVIQGDDYTRSPVRIDLDTSGLSDPNQDLSALKFVVAARTQSSADVIAVRMPIEGTPGSHYVEFDPPSSITENWPVGTYDVLYRLEWATNEYQTLNETGVLQIDPFDVDESDIVDL